MKKSPEDRSIFGWLMYDWANSAYATTAAVAVLPLYFSGYIVGDEVINFLGYTIDGSGIWGLISAFAAAIIFLFSPILGAISDYSASKKKFLMVFAFGGSLFTSMLYFTQSGDILLTSVLYIIAHIGFIGGNVFYDAFLPKIVPENKMDWYSGKGFSYGYIGGGFQYFLCLLLISFAESFNLTVPEASRIALAFTGVWWAGFSLITYKYLREDDLPIPLPEKYHSKNKIIAYFTIGIKQVLKTSKKVKLYKHLVLFLIAFIIYNDGIQTVLIMGPIYGMETLGIAQSDIMLTLLLIQIISVFGTLLFGKLGELITAKNALLITLFLWSVVVVYAYFLTETFEFYMLGMLIGLSMGGSQSLSRSLFGSMIPLNSTAEFYGFFSVFAKFSAITGPLVFSLIEIITGNERLSIVSVIIFFIIGSGILFTVNVEKAREARKAIN